MATFTSKPISVFDSEAQVLVNPVNCVGIHGAGLAKQFRDRFPENAEHHSRCCRCKPFVRPGTITTTRFANQRYIFNFPTKDHWSQPSTLEYIQVGAAALVLKIQEFECRSIAIPLLGCGLGGLRWSEVRPILSDHLTLIADLDVLYCTGNREAALSQRQTAAHYG